MVLDNKIETNRRQHDSTVLKLALVPPFIYVCLMAIMQSIAAIVRYYFYTEIKSLQGQVVLITGAGNGLGRGLVKEFAKNGCKLACVDIDEVSNTEIVAEINEEYPNCAKAYHANITKVKDIEAMAKQVEADWQHVDILVNNAGVITGAPLLDLADEEIEGVIQINLLSHFRMVRQFLPAMIRRNKGHVVAISSACSLTALNYKSPYVVSKWGINGFMECLEQELKEIPNNQIKTTTVCHYFIDTNPVYSRLWNLRLPILSPEYATQATVNAIKRNEIILTIPKMLYWQLILLKLLPRSTYNLHKKIFYTKMGIETAEERKNTTAAQIIASTLQK